MKLCHLLICAGVLAHAHAGTATDPFGGTTPSWTESVEAAKPLRLEICFGEANQKNPSKKIRDTDPLLNAITPEFLAAAKTLRIAVAPDDQGRLDAPDQLTAIYRLRTKDTAHSLDLNLILATGGRREINTSVTITDQWIPMGGLARTQVTTTTDGKTTETRKSLLIAVRLVPAQP